MDPVAHTLFGAALAECGLQSRSRYATPTLLIGANLPDIDVVSGLWGDDFELYFRRGLTHGVLAMLVLPLLLTGAVLLWHRWRGGARAGPQVVATAASQAFRPAAILLLAFISVGSHPLLDWMNTYGVRLLMPFDSRWFYGDTLFIADPWFWLLTATGVVLAHSRTRMWIARWTGLGLLASVLVLASGMVPPVAQLVWCAALLLVVLLRWRRPAWAPSHGVARIGMAALLLYIGSAFLLARQNEVQLAQRFAPVSQVQANPLPGNPFAHRTVVVSDDLYRIVDERGAIHELARQLPDPIVRAALDSASIRGFVHWMRFPYWSVEESSDTWTVRIQDLRYQGPDGTGLRGFGMAEVTMTKPTVAHRQQP